MRLDRQPEGSSLSGAADRRVDARSKSAPPPIAEIAAGIDNLCQASPKSLDDGALEAELLGLCRLLDRLEGRRVLVAAELIDAISRDLPDRPTPQGS